MRGEGGTDGLGVLNALENGDWGKLDVADDIGSGTADGVSGSE